MSFDAPIWLLALMLVPGVLFVQRLAARRRRRYALRFPAAGTLAELAEARSWERHLPAGIIVAALAALSLALARPHQSYRAAVGETAVMLVSDESGSMAADDVAPTRLTAAVQAAQRLMNELPPSVLLGAVAFSTAPNASQSPTADHAAARGIITAQVPNGGTDTGGALEQALSLLHGTTRHPPSAIVLLSDGSANLGPNPLEVAQTARREGIPIDTVALGTPGGILIEPNGAQIPVPPDPALMQRIAQISGGRTFTASSTRELGSIYSDLGRRLGTVVRRRDVTNAFALGGGLLMLLGGLLAAYRRGRLP